MARRSREIQTFNVAMLDVISSAMGAFLLLFLIMAERKEGAEQQLAVLAAEAEAAHVSQRAAETAAAQARRERAEADAARQEAEATQRDRDAAQARAEQERARAQRAQQSSAARAEQAEAALAAAQQEIDALEEALAAAEAALGGDGIANCRVSSPTIEMTAWDSNAVDGDLVAISLNEQVVAPRVSLPDRSQPWRYRFTLRRGVNVITIRALSDGINPPNTAGVRLQPCQNQQPYDTSWEMRTGEERTISVVYR